MTKIHSSLGVSPLTLSFTESKGVSVSSLFGFLFTWILVKLKNKICPVDEYGHFLCKMLQWPYFLISSGKFLLSSPHHYWSVSKTPTLLTFGGTDTDLTVKSCHFHPMTHSVFMGFFFMKKAPDVNFQETFTAKPQWSEATSQDPVREPELNTI